jgi:hypothetical protein
MHSALRIWGRSAPSVLEIDLDGLDLEEVEVFSQEGSKGMPAFAASTVYLCNQPNMCSCT